MSTPPGAHLSSSPSTKPGQLQSEVKEQIKAECFAVLEGMLAHDAAGADGYVDGGTQSGAPVAAEPAC